MSTKASFVWSEDVHFYHDLAEPGEDVFLELRGKDVEFEAGKDWVSVRIPLHIWEAIRHTGAARFDLADKTDDELRTMIEAKVEARIKDYNDAPDENAKRWRTFIGSGVFGGADEPKEKQIEYGMEHYQMERAYQREVREKMKALKVCHKEKADE